MMKIVWNKPFIEELSLKYTNGGMVDYHYNEAEQLSNYPGITDIRELDWVTEDSSFYLHYMDSLKSTIS